MGSFAPASRMLALLALVSLILLPGPAAGQEESLSVDIRDFAYNPASLTVAAGSTVTWTNSDSAPHTATGVAFDTGTLSRGQTGSATFADAGEFAYSCTIHPSIQGVITVQ